jgi:phosphoribosylformylglycinamidine synthase subunit PurL
MGAAGITCSSCEMSGQGRERHGASTSTSFPFARRGCRPYEILLSEARSACSSSPNRARGRVKEIFDKWDLHAVTIGHVTSDGMVTIERGGEVVSRRSGRAPRPRRRRAGLPSAKRARLPRLQPWPSAWNRIPVTAATARRSSRDALSAPNIASKRWVYEQYDTSVRRIPRRVRVAMLP